MKKLFTLLIMLLFFAPLPAHGEVPDLADYYMEYNGIEREDAPGQTYLSLDLPKDYSIPWLSVDNALRISSGYLYFGANWCPYCRNFIGVLMQAARDTESDQLYAVNIDDIKSLWALNADNQPIITREGSKNYDALLAYLSPLLSEYILTDEQGQKHPTGEKRIYMPCVFLVEDGEPISRWSLSSAQGYQHGADAHAAWTAVQKGAVYESISSFLRKTSLEADGSIQQSDCDCVQP